METLPSGFSYESSDLFDAAVEVEGQAVAFTLLGDERFTYTVAVPSAEGPHSFSGVLLDSHRVEQAVGGDSSIRVGPEPTPTPEPTATPTPEPTLPGDALATALAKLDDLLGMCLYPHRELWRPLAWRWRWRPSTWEGRCSSPLVRSAGRVEAWENAGNGHW